jgi:hypothetical protein
VSRDTTTIGVALATCNGAAFLQEQLDSLRRQTRPPDHIVVSDDASTDDTLALVEQFRRSASCRVDVIAGTARLGPLGNFMRAASACATDFVAFCDQDDVWAPRKIEVAARWLSADISALIHSTDHFSAEDSLRQPPVRVPDRRLDGLGLAPNRVFFGMSMVVRTSLLEWGEGLKAAWEERFDQIATTRPVCLLDHWSHAHDMFALTLARLAGRIVLRREPLAARRVHPQNYSTGGSSWRQAPAIADSWGSGREVGYLLLAAFCRDFGAIVHADETAIPVPASRRREIVDHYARWATIWEARGRLHTPGTSRRARTKHLLGVARSRGYAGSYRGGLGPGSLAKDALAAIGAR